MIGNDVVRLGAGIVLMIVAAAAAPQSCQVAEPDTSISSAAAVARLTKEVKDLEIQVLQLRLENEQSRVEALERESRDAEDELRELPSQEEALRQELEDMQRQLADPGLSAEQRTDIAANVSEALRIGTARLRDQRVAAERRGSEVRVRLSRAYEARSRLLARATALGVTIGAVSSGPSRSSIPFSSVTTAAGRN